MDKLLKILQEKQRDEFVTEPEKSVEDVYQNVAQNTGLTREDIAKIGGVESHHGKYIKNMGGGSATGLFQIMPNLAKRLNPELDVGQLESLDTQEDLASELINYNLGRIKKIKPEPSVEDVYAFHNLGPGHGKKFVGAADNTPISQVLPQRFIDANKKIYGSTTVKEARKNMKNFLDERGEYEFSPQFLDLFKGNKES